MITKINLGQYIDLNETLSTSMKTLGGSTLANKLIKNQVGYLSPALIPAKAVNNDQKYLAVSR